MGCCATLKCEESPELAYIAERVDHSRAVSESSTWLGAASAREEELVDSLRRELKGTRILRTADHWATSELAWWSCVESSFDLLVTLFDPRYFRRWPLLHNLMETVDREDAVENLNEIGDAEDAMKYLQFAAEKKQVGCPIVFPITLGGKETFDVSASSVGYSFLRKRFEALMRKKGSFRSLEDAGVILEFGAGFGLLPRLLFDAKFKGYYLMWDLPVFSAIQAFYLRLAGLKVARTARDLVVEGDDTRILCTSVVGEVFEAMRLLTTKPVGPRLFIATWSLSEAPNDRRKEVEAVLEAFRFDHLFIAYQRTFHDVRASLDNTAYFTDLALRMPHLDFQETSLKRPVDILLVARPNPDYVWPVHTPSPVALPASSVTVEVDIDEDLAFLTVREDESIKAAVASFMRLHALEDEEGTSTKLRQAVHLAFADLEEAGGGPP